jgi:hypothetical protein
MTKLLVRIMSGLVYPSLTQITKKSILDEIEIRYTSLYYVVLARAFLADRRDTC